jgi:hypothetical protein
MNQTDLTSLPDSPILRRDMTIPYLVSLIVAALLFGLALAGLLAPAVVYPTGELQSAFATNDATSLMLALPVLLASVWLAWRGRLLGLLLWPGVLLYILYNTVAYLAALPVGLVFGLNVVLTLLAVFAAVRVVLGIDAAAVRQRLTGRVPARWAAATLLGLGLLFFARAAFTLGSAAASSAVLPASESATLVADLFAGLLWVAAGWLLWRRAPLGFVLGAAVLFQAGLLFAGLLLFFLLQPLLTGVPFAAADFLVVALMSLVVLLPLVGFVRGIIAAQSKHS